MAEPPPASSSPAANRERIPFDHPQESDRRTLPPVVFILAPFVIIAIITVAWLVQANTARALGTIDKVVAVEQADKANVIVALHISVENVTDKTQTIGYTRVKLETSEGANQDEPSSESDWPRYYQAFPELKEGALQPLRPETKIAPRQKISGMVIVGFPVSKASFDARKSLTATIDLENQQPLTAVEKK